MARAITIGSVSTGTLKTDDLLEAFGWELQHVSDTAEHQALAKEARERAHYFTWNDLPESEDVQETEADSDLVNALIDALTDLAPLCCYFGSHEGDGADFGFWPMMDCVDELTHVSDPGEVEQHLGEPCVFVNDHGNVTVYNSDGTVAWDCV